MGLWFSNLTKPLLFFATSWGLVLAVRFLDRVGKGIRSALLGALIADVIPPELPVGPSVLNLAYFGVEFAVAHA